MESMLIIISVLALIAGTITDLKRREVPDWINFALIASGLGIRSIMSVTNNEWSPIIEGIIGLVIMTGLAFSLFYLGQFGGGDAKMLIGLGATIGFWPSLNSHLGYFLLASILTGAIYGMAWSIVLAWKNKKRFLAEWKKNNHNPKIRALKFALLGMTMLFLLLGIISPAGLSPLILMLVISFNIMSYMWMLVKAVEKTCMIKKIPTENLTEGDWIAEKIKKGKRIIVSPKDLGISKSQIKELKRLKIKQVMVKIGIPFIPSFLIAFIISIIIPSGL